MSAQEQQEPDDIINDDIINKVIKDHQNLADFKNNPELKFEVYKLAIEIIFNTLKDEKKLRTLPLKSLEVYDEGLGEIAGGFFDLYRSSLISNKLKREKIQPLIDDANRKLSTAISFIQGDSMAELKGSDLDECLGYIMICRSKLFELHEYLITIQFNKS
jgi:hypothetical protein